MTSTTDRSSFTVKDSVSPSAIERVVERSDGTHRSGRQECKHAFCAGVRQFAADGDVEIIAETLDDHI